MSESIRAYCIQWSVAFTTNCQLSGLSICPVQQCSPVPEPEPPYGSPYCCSALVIVHQLIPWGLLYTMYNACKKICERKDTRLRLRLCIRIRAGWKEAQQEECLENALGLVTALVFYPYLPLAKIFHISSLMIWWLVVCPSSPLVRVIVLPCSFYYPSSFLQPAPMLPLPAPAASPELPLV